MIEDFKYITEYIQNNTYLNEDKILLEIEKEALENKIPIITKDVLQYLLFMIDLVEAKNVLELGTATGYSGSFIAKNLLKRKGTLTTIEIDEKRYLKANEVFKSLNLENIYSYHMDGLEYLDKTDKTFDFIFLDAQKGEYKTFLKKSYNLLEKKGIIFVDNVLFRSYIGKENDVPKKYKNMVTKMTKVVNNLLKQQNSTVLPFGDGIAIIRRED